MNRSHPRYDRQGGFPLRRSIAAIQHTLPIHVEQPSQMTRWRSGSRPAATRSAGNKYPQSGAKPVCQFPHPQYITREGWGEKYAFSDDSLIGGCGATYRFSVHSNCLQGIARDEANGSPCAALPHAHLEQMRTVSLALATGAERVSRAAPSQLSPPLFAPDLTCGIRGFSMLESRCYLHNAATMRQEHMRRGPVARPTPA